MRWRGCGTAELTLDPCERMAAGRGDAAQELERILVMLERSAACRVPAKAVHPCGVYPTKPEGQVS